MRYTITLLGNLPQYVITNASGQFIAEYASLALALGFLATVMQFGDSIVYIDEALKT
jgi:hypothetical protein